MAEKKEKKHKESYSFIIAGNPNSGKTTFFNSIVGGHNKVGNWPGVTVEKFEGYTVLNSKKLNFTDLPGTYSLNPDSEDQKVAGRAILEGNYDAALVVIDATHLARSLNLVFQVMTMTKNCAVLLNMIDVAKKEGIEVDVDKLEELLGVPVIPVVAVKKKSVKKALTIISEKIVNSNTENIKSEIKDNISTAKERFDLGDKIAAKVVTKSEKKSFTDKVDSVVLNRFAAVPIFLVVMFLVFWFAVNVGSIFIDFFDIVFGAIFVDWFGNLLLAIGSPEWLKVLLADGIGAGIQTVATFIPVVFFMFLMMSILEDSGYMARAAFMADKLMKRIGLPGTSFVPLIVGFGCTVPAVMGTRILTTKSDRLKTIFMAPFMSCGARLPVYALFCAAIFGRFSGLVVFSIYLVGVLAAILTGLLLKRTIFKGKSSSFFIELPKYHTPIFRNVMKYSGIRLKFFLKKATVVVVIAVAILGLLNSIGVDNGKVTFGNEDSENSTLTIMGKSMSPIIKPFGVDEDNWPAGVALFTGLFAKEAIVGTVNSLYGQLDVKEVLVEDVIDEQEEAISLAFPLGDIADAFKSIWENFLGVFISADLVGVGVISEDQETVSEELETDASVFKHLKDKFTPLQAYAYLLFVLMYFPCLAVVGAVRKEAGWLYTLLMIFYTTSLAWIVAVLFYQIAEGRNWAYTMIAIVYAGFVYLVFKIISIFTKDKVELKS